MTTKKGKEEITPKIILGRPSNNLTMGIVGLPNVVSLLKIILFVLLNQMKQE